MGLGISTGFAMSVQIRCISFLLIPTFFGKAGRSYVGTFAIAFLIAGNIIFIPREFAVTLERNLSFI